MCASICSPKASTWNWTFRSDTVLPLAVENSILLGEAGLSDEIETTSGINEPADVARGGSRGSHHGYP